MSSTARTSEALVSDPLFPRLKQQLLESTGLAYYVDKDEDFSRRVGRRLATTGAADCASYLSILRDPIRGPSELDALIAEVTIGETYFFRHQEQFDALRDLVLPDLIVRNEAERRLRIWCAGCADGSEPYSLAILLKRDMAHRFPGWTVTILGTDINRQCLARAREGMFEEWAFRSMPEDLKRNCFQREGKLWRIAPHYKECVSFQRHNLVEDSFPPLLHHLLSFDLIICRNVMIYFGPQLMQRVIRQFHDCLVPGAWLLVGPSEPNLAYFSSFRAVNAPGVTLYQKPDASPPCEETAVTLKPLPPLPASPRMDISETTISMTEAQAGENMSPSLIDVRRHADQGEWGSALQCCEQLLKKDNLNAKAHFYQALVLYQMKRYSEAEQSLRRALYLDRRFVLAHYYLGLFLQSRGDSRLAARSFENALELMSSLPDEEVFAEGDGINVAELKELVKLNLDVLPERK